MVHTKAILYIIYFTTDNYSCLFQFLFYFCSPGNNGTPHSVLHGFDTGVQSVHCEDLGVSFLLMHSLTESVTGGLVCHSYYSSNVSSIEHYRAKLS